MPPAFDDPPDWLAGVFPRAPDASDQKQLGYLYLLVGALPRAREEFALGLSRVPDDDELRVHLAAVQHALGERDEARQNFERLPASLFRRSDLWELRAQLALRTGALAEAYDFLQRALALPGGDTPERRARLSRLAQALGREDEARTWRQGLFAPRRRETP